MGVAESSPSQLEMLSGWKGILVKDEFIKTLQSGVNLSNEDKFDEAIAKFDDLIELYNPMVQALIQRGRCHWEMRRWELAQADFLKARAMDSDNNDIPWTMSLMNLQMRDFEKGWETFDLRWKSKKFDSPRLKTKQPQWEPFAGYKDLLVWSEQGVGDQILYCSLLRSLKDYVPELTVMMDARLIPLFKRSFDNIQFIPQNTFVSEIDSQIPMGSVAKELVRDISDIQRFRADPYLIPDYARASLLRATLGVKEGERLIGISWASGAPRIGNHKSASLEDFLPLFRLPNTRFVTLQYGDHYQEIYQLEKDHGVRIEIVPEVDNTQDLDGLAALITACDCVVTVSNVTGHIAGAVGARTFLLDSNKLWYWNSCQGNRNLWYPTVSTYRKDNAIAPWTSQIAELTADVDQYLNNPMKYPPTFVFFRTGNEEMIWYTRKFVESLRASNPEAEIIMCTDSLTPHIEGVTRRFELDLDVEQCGGFMRYRLEIYSALGLRQPAMYLDDDMLVHAEIYPELLLGDKDVLLCERSFDRDLYFNTSIKGLDFREHAGKKMAEVYPYLACATVTRNSGFWGELLQIMDHIHPKYSKWYGDQEAMRIWSTMNKDFGTLKESEYACLPEYKTGEPKIMHYKGSRKEKMR